MGKTRLEAFSDGVIAIIITIMVLEMRAPEGADLASLERLLPIFLSYVLKFCPRRHLLEQPPPPASHRPTRDRRDPLGQPSLAVLALARAVRDGMDGGEPLRAAAGGALGAGHDDGRRRGLHPDRRPHPAPRTRVATACGSRERSQGRDVSGDLRRGDCALVCEPVGVSRALRRGGAHVAGARPPHRAPTHQRRAGPWTGQARPKDVPYVSRAAYLAPGRRGSGRTTRDRSADA